jgi:DNA-binding NtrC family response regulator
VNKSDPNSLRVLVVEDERRLRALMLEMIPELGFDATGASSAEEAISIMESDPRDILLLDLQLPGMGGMELFEQVRQRWPETEVVILTAFGDLQTARRAIHLDAVEFLCKPFHLRDIELAFDRARKRVTQRPSHATIADPLPFSEHGPTLAQAEYHHILASLQRHAGNRTAAAAELGISRRTLHYRLAEYRDRGWQVE